MIKLFDVNEQNWLSVVSLSVKEEPACYDLQQFMIDQRFQNKNHGTMLANR